VLLFPKSLAAKAAIAWRAMDVAEGRRIISDNPAFIREEASDGIVSCIDHPSASRTLIRPSASASLTNLSYANAMPESSPLLAAASVSDRQCYEIAVSLRTAAPMLI